MVVVSHMVDVPNWVHADPMALLEAFDRPGKMLGLPFAISVMSPTCASTRIAQHSAAMTSRRSSRGVTSA